MILFANKNDQSTLEKVDMELVALSVKTVSEKNRTKIKNIVKDSLKSFFVCFLLLLTKKEHQTVYIAIVPCGGIGDVVRQKAAVEELFLLFRHVVIDIYGRRYKFLFGDFKNIRFFADKNAIKLTRKKYDIVLDYATSNVTSGIANLTMNNLRNGDLKRFFSDFKKIKQEFQYCFNVKNQFLFQKEAIRNNLRFTDVVKLTTGIKNFKKSNLKLDYTERDIVKFGLSKSCKYITFQHGYGFEKNVRSKIGWRTKIWETKNWERLFKNIKASCTDYKIVQVGISSDLIGETEINLVGKTSFDDLCSVMKYSSLHIDADCGCMHIAKALNVKSVILFGPSSAKYIGYDTNINIVSGLCSDCYTIRGWELRCLRNLEKPLCMSSISPDFVAEVILKYLKNL
ncbi:MAG: hypothetical protein LBU29_03695 [Endomicrobium sp.]|jgi:ADP-heptose:LPS heptosyltransferase|nr:hypothetical protein [Endomicrobium sp.]